MALSADLLGIDGEAPATSVLFWGAASAKEAAKRAASPTRGTKERRRILDDDAENGERASTSEERAACFPLEKLTKKK